MTSTTPHTAPHTTTGRPTSPTGGVFAPLLGRRSDHSPPPGAGPPAEFAATPINDTGDNLDGRSRSRPTETILATLALIALSVVTAIGFCRVFNGWDFLAPMLVVVIGIHVFALGLRLLNVPGYVAVPAAVLVLFALVAWKYYPTTLSGPFPTSTTWRFMSTDIRLAREQFPSATAPVAAVGGFVVAATTATGVAALLSDAFAFRAYGRAEAAVPSAVLFVFASALGVDKHRVVLSAVWLGAALIVIAVLRLTHAQDEHAWIGRSRRVAISVLPLAGVLAVGAAFAGAIVGPLLPGAGAKGLIDTRDKGSVTQVLSPLVDIRFRLISLSDVELFTVGASEPHYWRATGLSQFNGTIWGIPEGTAGGKFPDSPPIAGARTLNQDIHILGLSGPLVPAAYSPESITGGSAYYVPDTGTLVEPGAGMKRNTDYQIVSTVLDLSPDQLRVATSLNPASIELDLPSDFPATVTQLAQQLTASSPTVYDKAIALQNWFRANFTYDLSVQRGHGDDALENFLRIKRGYCEQFSAAFAAMARSVGIPARVAVGFTFGDKGQDNRYHVYGRNAHAWPEVWFDNIGWVSFEPTPGRGEPGTEAYTGVAPAEATTNNDPSLATSDTVATPASSTTIQSNVATATTLAEPTDLPKPKPKATSVEPPVKKSSGGVSRFTEIFFGAILLALLWALILPRLLRFITLRRRPPSPVEQIRQSWERAAAALGLINLAPAMGETPLEHARRTERMTGIDRRALRELAANATAAMYGDVGDRQIAARSALLAATIIGAVTQRLSPREKFAARFDPRRAGILVRR